MPPAPDTVRRHFLSWERPWIERVTEWLAAGWDGRGPLDLSATLAIVPTQQSGRRLREALAEYAAARGGAVFSPRVLTPEALLQQDLAPDAASPLQTLLAWSAVFRELDLSAHREIFPVDPPARNFPWSLRLAQQFARLQFTLSETGLRLGDVAGAAGGDFPEQARWEAIAALEALHEAQLARQGLREPNAARIGAVAAPLLERQFQRIVILAAPDVSPLAIRRLTNAASVTPVEVLVFAPADEAGSFDAWGRPASAAWEKRVLELPDFEQRVHLCPDPASQASRLADLVGRYKGVNGILAVGIADPEIAPLLENELNRRHHPVFNPEGRPMRQEGLHGLLTCLAELVRDPAFTTVEALGHCPDFIAFLQARHGADFSAAWWLRSLDDLRADHLPADLEAARQFASRPGYRVELSRGLQTTHEVRERLAAQAFSSGAAEALREIFGRRHLDRTRERDLRFEGAATAWTDLLRECAAAENQFGGLTVSDWWELALRHYGDQRSSEEKPGGALELQGWIELLWEDAPHLAVVGMNDGHVPEAVPEDAFLPGSLRQRLGLTTNATRFARDAYLLQAIAASRAGTGRLDLLFGKAASTGDPLRPSRLLLRCSDDALPERIAFLFRSPEIAEASSSWTRAWRLQPRVECPPERVAVTALRRYLLCPFRFYLRTVLQTESVDPWKSELDAFDFGTLCHAALERIGSDASLRECTDGEVLRAEVLRQLDREVLSRYGKVLPLPLLIQIESARQRLARLAELQALERSAGWEIVDVERAFEVAISGLLVRGKIDRIDRHAATGAVRVLDYKTSDRPRPPAGVHLRALRPGERVPEWAQVMVEGKARAWADLQLPLYLHALAGEFPGRVTCGYFNLPKASGETALALWDDYTPALHESALRCAEGACAAIRRGDFWPPNEGIRADRDDCAALFHRGVEDSVEWSVR
jgi:ATP-dependent helicase/nuclease subunit B